MSISVPAFDHMMQTLIDVLRKTDQPLDLNDLRRNIATNLKLTSEQLQVLHNPENETDRRSKFQYNLAWTCTYLKNAGLIINPKRGMWQLTELGRQTVTVDPTIIKSTVRTYRTKTDGDEVTIPEDTLDLEEQDDINVEQPVAIPETKGVSEHLEIQWLLFELGSKLNLKVWIASSDKHREYQQHKFNAQSHYLDKLPPRFDPATQKVVEQIDVIWVKGQQLVAAFEIENTSAIYSGLLRLSDLKAMQPDITTSLYIVAPDERELEVRTQMGRPTFSKATNLARSCRYLTYTGLREAVEQGQKLVKHLNPGFIDVFAKSLAEGSED